MDESKRIKIELAQEIEEILDTENEELAQEYAEIRQQELDELDEEEMNEIEAYFFPDE